jgi:hypothetical protein
MWFAVLTKLKRKHLPDKMILFFSFSYFNNAHCAKAQQKEVKEISYVGKNLR